jgi:hypothetical protein
MSAMGHKINGIDFMSGPGGGLLTWHERPVTAAEHLVEAIPVPPVNRPAIVLQGGLVAELDFTLQTLELYRRMHPQARLVLSTWEGEDAAHLERARELGVQVVLSTRPAHAGQQNVNLQIVSSAAGVRAAQAAGASHILKTRSDQRLGAPNLFDLMDGLQGAFPLRDAPGQQGRLLALSLNTFRYRMYGVSDMFLYGHADDVVNYWTPPLDERVFDPAVRHFHNLRSFSQWRICEVYFLTEYLQRMGHTLAWTLRDYWQVMAERFCIVDAASIDLFWPKYTQSEHRWRFYDQRQLTYAELDFAGWMALHVGWGRIEHFPEHRLG